MDKFPITQEGYKKLEEEIKHLKREERPKIIEAIATAREFGDLSENAEYHAAKEKQGFTETRIKHLESIFSRAEIINFEQFSNDTVKFGAKVKLIDDETEQESIYRIVSEYEANIKQQKISISSPLAKALIGKSVGDIVEVMIPSGERSYEITEITFRASG